MDPENVLRTYPSVSTSSKNVFLPHFPFFSLIREVSSVHQCKVASLAASQRIQSVPEINILREENTTNNCDTVASTSLVMVQNAEPAISPEKQADREILLENEVGRLRQLCEKMTNELSKLKRKTICLEHTSHSLKENTNETVESFLAANNVNHETRKAMIQLQLRPENSKEPYPATQKSLAMKLHYWSASSYERLRQSGLQLPHTRSVEKWIAEYAEAPGFLDQSVTMRH